MKDQNAWRSWCWGPSRRGSHQATPRLLQRGDTCRTCRAPVLARLSKMPDPCDHQARSSCINSVVVIGRISLLLLLRINSSVFCATYNPRSTCLCSLWKLVMALRAPLTRAAKRATSTAPSTHVLSAYASQWRRGNASVAPVTQNAAGSKGPTAMVFMNMGGPSTTDEVHGFLSMLFVSRTAALSTT
jgi:hypothetical protein